MLKPEQILCAAERAAAAASSPATVMVVGSYARGDADEGSDLDLIVVEPDLADEGAEYLRLKAAIGRVGVGVDLLLFSRRDFDRRRLVPGTMPYWAMKEGRVLIDGTA